MADTVKQELNEDKKTNWAMFPILNFVYIFKNFVNGASFIFYHLPKKIMGNLNGKRVEALSQKEGRYSWSRLSDILKHTIIARRN